MAVIAISRGSHSGGRALAECVAERLGYLCVSREDNLNAAAATYGLSADSLRAEEKSPSIWDRLGGPNSQYLTYVRAALFERAREGNLIYHGHLGHLLLPGAPRVLRIRVVADMEFRIAAVVQQRNLTRGDAIGYIEKVDRERRDWIRFLFGVDWEDPSLYHAVLNLSLLGMDGACDLVAHLAEQEQFKATPDSIKALDNLALGSIVSAVLARDPRTAVGDLVVRADNGVATISGTIRSQEGAEAISQVVSGVTGIKEIANRVRVVAPYYR